MDGHRLPSREKYLENLARFPTLCVNLIPADSKLAASLFDDASIDFLFIDGCHDTDAVLRDIDVWLSKSRQEGSSQVMTSASNPSPGD